ncbi:hypothetical protein EX895_003159 [Sporisorium graminicola]|uniref:Zn(2)-C6 fungal-type domain-containing protein n=1 Tax=Sporisorium graminicola TaxID=280036 RepID=A0A4U7KU76_9BASI|nr:hypothetical protein EX895_003159 [Sporisorium graminicola]TKY88063.1 hypothetical protein EX895_003159 [Sporisorium graminicola]
MADMVNGRHSPSSASGSTSSMSALGSVSTSAASGVERDAASSAAAVQPPPSTPSQPVKRRRYARRSCLTCRSKKTRCELPDEGVPSSHDPLPAYKACHRCRALDIPCVVWDGDRKRKPRIDSPPRVHLSSHDANTALAYHRQHDRYLDNTSPWYSHHAGRPHAEEKPYTHPAWHSPSASRFATNHLSPGRADLYKRSRPASDLAPNETASRPSRTHSTTGAATYSISSPSPGNIAQHASTTVDGHYNAALFINPESSESFTKLKVTGHQIPILSNQYMHSPLVTLNRFITKTPPFSRLLRHEMDRSFDGQLSDLLTDENMHELRNHLPRLRMWHPHVPDLDALRTTFHERPSPSTSLLLATIAFVASKIAGDRHLAKHFATHVDRIGLQVLISAPKELHAAQAFELLLSHGPSLIGASVDNSAAASNNSSGFGESLHASAISIAEGIGLDLVMSQASQNSVEAAHDNPEDLEKLLSYLRRFSLWCSLSIWRSKFVFLNSVVRPYDFSRLRRDAEHAISIVDTLRQRDPAPAKTSKDDILFRAGILTLAYRAIQVADFHARLSQLEMLWNSRPLLSEVEVRHEVSSRFDQRLEFLESLRKSKRHKLWVMANLDELKFLDRWIDLEFESDWVFLFQIFMRMVLPANEATGTVLDVSRSIGRDASLSRFMVDAGKRSHLNNERTIAAFGATPRFEGENLEQTGLPLLLTCGYILHISICLMESLSFAQYCSHESSMREDVFALLLSKLAERFCGFAQSKAEQSESVEKLVASMLVQMVHRLEECDYYAVTKNKTQPTAQPPSSTDMTSDHDRRRSSEQSGQLAHAPSHTRFSTPPQHYDTRTSSDLGAAHGTKEMVADPQPIHWQDASSAGQSHSSRLALGSLIHPQSEHTPSGNSAGSMGSDDTRNTAAAPFASTSRQQTQTLLTTSDGWASDNMARIMDQILSWDCVAEMLFPNGA